MPFSATLIRKLSTVDAGMREILVSLLEEVEKSREETVTKREFLDLLAVMRELGLTTRNLAESQTRTNERLAELTSAQKDLAETQNRTEQRVGELTAAQKELTQAQNRTEQRVGELAQAQTRSERELQQLVSEQKKICQQVGGLSMTVGYGLEDKAYPSLPALLQRDFGLIVSDRLTRGYLKDKSGTDLEVNILGRGQRNGDTVTLIGEAKCQLSRRDIDTFFRKKVDRLRDMLGEIFPVLVTYMISDPSVAEYARARGVALYYSYDL